MFKSEARTTPGKKVWSKWVETRKDPIKPWYESSGVSPREGSTQPKLRTKCNKRCGWSSGYFEPHPRRRSLQRVLLANASFADFKAWRNRDTISFHVEPPKDLRRKRKIWSLRHESSVCNTRGGRSQRKVFRKTHWCHGGTGKQRRRRAVFTGEDGFIPAISGVRANDFEQLMRETFRVRACERVDRGFLTTVEFIRRKVAWNAQDFFWIYDPTHTLADCSDVHYGE